MQFLAALLLLSLGRSIAQVCDPLPLINGNFESGSLSPWSPSAENEPVAKGAHISTNAYKSKYSAQLTLIYNRPNPSQGAPLALISTSTDSCGRPQLLTFYYKIRTKPFFDNSFLAQIYDSSNKHVYVYNYITFNDTAVVDSEGNEYGKWHKQSITFQPTSASTIFSFILDGDINGDHGTSSVFIDNVSLTVPPS